MRLQPGVSILAACLVIGCNRQPPAQNAPPGTPPKPIVTPMMPGGENSGAAPVATPAAMPAAVPAGTPGEAPTEQVKAEAGVGVKGQSLAGESGILVEPAKAFFRFEQTAVFNIQIPQALQLFEASEGRKPKSEEEFMSRIVAANNINLPKLPEGHKYVYDVQAGELKVERPAK